jgi:hypothetical protein
MGKAFVIFLSVYYLTTPFHLQWLGRAVRVFWHRDGLCLTQFET